LGDGVEAVGGLVIETVHEVSLAVDGELLLRRHAAGVVRVVDETDHGAGSVLRGQEELYRTSG